VHDILPVQGSPPLVSCIEFHSHVCRRGKTPKTRDQPCSSPPPVSEDTPMHALRDAHPHVKAFIAYAREDEAEAERYRALLDAAGFKAYKFSDNSPGSHFDAAKEISECSFFLLLVSPFSINHEGLFRCFRCDRHFVGKGCRIGRHDPMNGVT
jgi:hypothetical protein